MAVDSGISGEYCIFGSQECTTGEALGQYSLVLLFVSLFAVTTLHQVYNRCIGKASFDEKRTTQHAGSAWLHFFINSVAAVPFVLSLAFRTSNFKVFHPVQVPYLQLVGGILVVFHVLLFIYVHISMGKSWSAKPESKDDHALVKTGLFALARHPMYANWIWTSISIFLATLNWLIAVTWLFFWACVVLDRVPKEERILYDLFKEDYLQYRTEVGAMGPRWICCYAQWPQDPSGQFAPKEPKEEEKNQPAEVSEVTPADVGGIV